MTSWATAAHRLLKNYCGSLLCPKHLLLRLQLVTVMWHEHWQTDMDNDGGTHTHARTHTLPIWFATRLGWSVVVSFWWWKQGADGSAEWWWWWAEKVIVLQGQTSTNTHTPADTRAPGHTVNLLFTEVMRETAGPFKINECVHKRRSSREL